jgi:ribosomal protein S19
MARSVWKGKFVEESLWFSMRKRLDEWKVGSSSVLSDLSKSLKQPGVSQGVKGVSVEKGSKGLGGPDFLAGANLCAGSSDLYANVSNKGSASVPSGSFAPALYQAQDENKEEAASETKGEKIVVVPKKGGFRLALRSGDSHLQANALRCWSRSSSILAEWVGYGIYVYNGQNFHFLSMKASMVGHKLGEYAPTRKAGSHLKKKKDKKAGAKK